jgi:hypothetical protein
MITIKDLLDHLLKDDKRIAFYYPNYIWIECLKIRLEVLISTSTSKDTVHYALIVPVGYNQHKILGNLLIRVINKEKTIKNRIDESDVLDLNTTDLAKVLEDFNTLFIL